MSDNRQGRSRDAGDRSGDDARRVQRIRRRQDFWAMPDDGQPRRRVHRASRTRRWR